MLTQGRSTPGPTHDAAKHSSASKGCLPGYLSVGAVSKHLRLITHHHFLKNIRLGGVGPRQGQRPVQAAVMVHVEVAFVADVSVFGPISPLRLGIGASPVRVAGEAGL